MLENIEFHSTKEQSSAKHHITEAEDLAFIFSCAYRHMQMESESKHPMRSMTRLWSLFSLVFETAGRSRQTEPTSISFLCDNKNCSVVCLPCFSYFAAKKPLPTSARPLLSRTSTGVSVHSECICLAREVG